MVGGVLTSLGFVFSAFARSLLHLYLGLGVLAGSGWALVFAPALGTLSRYFSRRRVLAVGLALTGNGASSLLLAPTLQLLLDTFGWRGALLVLGAITLHLAPCGALLRPLVLPGDPPAPPRGPLAALGLGLFARRAFSVFALGTALVGGGYFVPYVHLAPHALDRGLGGYGAALVVAVAAVGDAGARLISGWLADQGWVPLSRLLLVFGALTGLGVLAVGLVPLAGSQEGCRGALLAAAGAYGLSAGSYAPLVFGVLPGLVGVGGVVQATGLVMMLMSVGGLLGPPLSGKGPSQQIRSQPSSVPPFYRLPPPLGPRPLNSFPLPCRLPKGRDRGLHRLLPRLRLFHYRWQLHLHGAAGGAALLPTGLPLPAGHPSSREGGAAPGSSGRPALLGRPSIHSGHYVLTVLFGPLPQ
ncbi:monocarboxylate transporter 11 isoform X3 [Leopardus geoffroyi]|nr:monocarboxylate transporter 11 isoform X3 [Leopardus geoffroyi]